MSEPNFEDMPIKTVNLVCHTQDCSNAEIEIQLQVPEIVEDYTCGVCDKRITDVTIVDTGS